MASVARGPGRPAIVAGVAVAAVVLVVVGFLLGRDPRPHALRPGPVDVGFAQDMATHHDQAVLMANLALTRGDQAVQGIADSILTNQSEEIGQLRGWLQLWGRSIADPHPMSWMPAGAIGMSAQQMAQMQQSDAMPGMATPLQLAALYARTGKQFDVLFLQLMIRHHQGGIEMAHYAEVHATLDAVRTAATAMRAEQVQDLALMQPLLAADGGSQLPTP